MINWGIIGAGNIAHRFAESLAQKKDGRLYAVANRTLEKAVQFQERHSCEQVYANYNDLLNDEQVDMVYIALPHQYHFEWIKQALLHHKGVLCEKPATMSASQMREVKALAEQQGVFFMEAMKNRFVPAFEMIYQHIKAGDIGDIVKISTSLCRLIPKANTSYHYLPIQGGCLLDLGIYNVGLFEPFIKQPLRVSTLAAALDENDVEVYVKARLVNAEVEVILETAFNQTKLAEATFTGTKGQIRVLDFHRPTQFSLEIYGESVANFDYPYLPDDFSGEIQAAMTAFSEGALESDQMSLQSSVNCITLLDEIKQKLTEGAFINLASDV